MRLRIFLTVVSIAVLTGASARLFAQSRSLGDVAKIEEERRQAVKEPAKVYTNKDLGNVPPASPAGPPASAPQGQQAPSTPAGGAKGAERDKAKDQDKDQTATKDQAYWAGRMKQLQEQLARDQTYAEAMQSRINGLITDFAARDDPAQRAVIDRDRQKAVAELGRLNQTIQNDKKAATDLEEEARRAGVPPGWLR